MIAVRAIVAASLALTSCLSPYEARHVSRPDARAEIWLSEESQVKLRAAQSRVFETTDRTAILEGVIGVLQDLGFMIEVLDEELGIVSALKFLPIERPELLYDPSYHWYDDQGLVLFTRAFRTWGPFYHRDDLVRATVTVRARGDSQSVVRASAQFYMAAVEEPEPFQEFFRALERALFLQGQTDAGGS